MSLAQVTYRLMQFLSFLSVWSLRVWTRTNSPTMDMLSQICVCGISATFCLQISLYFFQEIDGQTIVKSVFFFVVHSFVYAFVFVLCKP